MPVIITEFNSFSADLAYGGFDFTSDATSAITVALSNVFPLVTYSDISQISQIDYTGLSSRRCSISYSAQINGEYKLKLDDIILTTNNTIPTFRYVILYDAFSGKLMGYYNYGTAINIDVSKRFVIDFDNVNGVFKIGKCIV